LVIFAFLETILFTYIFGMKKGWVEINRGADIRIPGIYKWIMTYVTPVLLFLVLMGALITPAGNDWAAALANLVSGEGWSLDPNSLIAKLSFADLKAQLAANPENSEFIEKKMLFSGWARIQLLVLFLVISGIVWYSSQQRKKANL